MTSQATNQEAGWGGTRHQTFVDNLFLKSKNKGFRSQLRRAESPATEHKVWEILVNYNVDIERPYERTAYALICASIGYSKDETDGNIGLGEAIALLNKKDNGSNELRFRRILSSADTLELCSVLRPVLRLIASKGIKLSRTQLLKDVLYFSGDNRDRIRRRWAKEFYRKEIKGND